MWVLFASLSDLPPETLGEPAVQELVRQALDGNVAAASRLYRRFVVHVYRAVRPLSDSDSDAEDLVQDTFVKAFASLDRYQPRADTRFLGWLVTIALNDARKRRVRGRRRRQLEERELKGANEAMIETPEGALQRAQRKQQLLAALQLLSERDREIMCLRYGAGLGAEEVALACDTTAANVRKICERQRHRLRGSLERASAGTKPSKDEVHDETLS